MTVAVCTMQRGRHAHLARQAEALALSSVPAAHVVLSMDDEPPVVPGAHVLHRPVAANAPLPLAAARNALISHATGALGAELAILLDVDCLPSEWLVERYVAAAAGAPGTLISGAVHYLPQGVPAAGPLPSREERAATPPHPARPAPAPGQIEPEARYELFWSLSFAVTAATHQAIGGFDEAYDGYGGEDTDYAFRARAAGVPFAWVGGAEAYHQHHPVSDPPVEHLADIVRNARRFHQRWGVWPMRGWLEGFAAAGLVHWAGAELALTPA